MFRIIPNVRFAPRAEASRVFREIEFLLEFVRSQKLPTAKLGAGFGPDFTENCKIGLLSNREIQILSSLNFF